MDTRISQVIQDPSALEDEILDAEEIQYNIAEKITLIKAVLPRPRQLNIQATPFQPHVEVHSPLLRDHQPQLDTEQPQGGDSPVINTSQEEEPSHNNEPEHEELLTQRRLGASAFTSVSQNASRLPKLTLPTFEGDSLEWKTSFDSAVHSNNVLSDVQRLNSLRAHLGGEASRAIAGFPLTSANYRQSVGLLRDRFGQPQRIVNAHMQTLMN